MDLSDWQIRKETKHAQLRNIFVLSLVRAPIPFYRAVEVLYSFVCNSFLGRLPCQDEVGKKSSEFKGAVSLSLDSYLSYHLLFSF